MASYPVVTVSGKNTTFDYYIYFSLLLLSCTTAFCFPVYFSKWKISDTLITRCARVLFPFRFRKGGIRIWK